MRHRTAPLAASRLRVGSPVKLSVIGEVVAAGDDGAAIENKGFVVHEVLLTVLAKRMRWRPHEARILPKPIEVWVLGHDLVESLGIFESVEDSTDVLVPRLEEAECAKDARVRDLKSKETNTLCTREIAQE